ncbi:MAG: aldehyde ferredoxin oxidoreductase C-terminal domain-containing protein, partial [Dehalococcoidales bacterium]|nr:aldehyde ferredoxin oxidoreductase C-terminal domain-containing protein [Dehalococcoidales bacterium]
MIPTASKHAVASKSPQTGFMGDSLSSSFWSLALKRAGYDAIVITGACDSLSYLFIDDDIVHFKRAGHLAGKGCSETEETVRREIGDDRVRVAAIGPGGENKVLYASISNDIGRRAGRAGMGAVMGSKNLKAIAIRGTRAVAVANLEEVQRIAERLYQKSQGTVTENYRVLGTSGNVLTLNRLAALPTLNFQQSTFDQAENVSGEYLHEHHLAWVVACAGCSIACEHIYRVTDGPYDGAYGRMDYETIFALGPLCGVGDAGAVIRAAERCDHYGIDSISAGNTIAWAMECFQKGILTTQDTDGLDLSFGNGSAVVEMVERIGQRQGLGDLLADGVKKAADRLGKGSEHWAMHVKGLE